MKKRTWLMNYFCPALKKGCTPSTFIKTSKPDIRNFAVQFSPTNTMFGGRKNLRYIVMAGANKEKRHAIRVQKYWSTYTTAQGSVCYWHGEGLMIYGVTFLLYSFRRAMFFFLWNFDPTFKKSSRSSFKRESSSRKAVRKALKEVRMSKCCFWATRKKYRSIRYTLSWEHREVPEVELQ